MPAQVKIPNAATATQVARKYVEQTLGRPLLTVEEVRQTSGKWRVTFTGLGSQRYVLTINGDTGEILEFKRV